MLVTVYMAVCVALFGLLIGSFLNVCIFRLPLEQSIAFPPSHCMDCGHKLGVLDLFPLFSYLFLGGKCRYCKAKISPQYPCVEALNSIIYVLGFCKFGLTPQFVFFALLCSALIVITFTDFKHMTIPTAVIIIVFVLGILYMLLAKDRDLDMKYSQILLDSLWGFLAGGGFFLVLYFVTRRNVGEGDIMLMAALGVWLGLRGTILAALLAFVIGAIVSVFMVVIKGGSRKTMVPFGPFIAIGSVISFCFYSDIVDWYFGFFEYL